ncbi:inner membrane protein [Salmonella enterica subsp. enterica]|nr:inner membrane protein [Salmonella enterica subsp. enterica]
MMDLFKAIGLGLVVLLPLANPLTTGGAVSWPCGQYE